MIAIRYPAKKKPFALGFTRPTPDAQTSAGRWMQTKAKDRGISLEEYLRRDTIIRKLFEECPFKVGDTIYPKNKKMYEEYGALKIRFFISQINQMPKDEEWPLNDNPLIVSCTRIDKHTVVTCTTNFASATNPHL